MTAVNCTLYVTFPIMLSISAVQYLRVHFTYVQLPLRRQDDFIRLSGLRRASDVIFHIRSDLVRRRQWRRECESADGTAVCMQTMFGWLRVVRLLTGD